MTTMNQDRGAEARRGRRWLPLLWIGGSFAVFYLLFFDPLNFHPLDDWLSPTRGEQGAVATAVDDERATLWTCPMHPQILEDVPGECPICGMDLVAVSASEIAPEAQAPPPAPGSEETTLWTCSMHPHVLESEPGVCPICRMDLVAVSASEALPEGQAAAPAPGSQEATLWTCPMHPHVLEESPGECPICGMDLVAVAAPETESAGRGGAMRDGATAPGSMVTTVTIDPAVVQNMNVQTELAARRDLNHEIRTVGYLEYDQERMVTVTTKYSGWVEKVYVNYVGEPVRRGQPLFEVYSPELIQTEQELLSAIDYARRLSGSEEGVRRRAEALVDAARTRLSYWDIAPRQIDELVASGEVFRTLEVVAPAGGVVMKRMPGLEGMAVRPGMEAYHIADLSSLWLSVEVFEEQVAWIAEGTPAEVAFTYFPGETFRGTVRFIEPEFSEKTRTLRVKLEVPNRDRRLRAGMFATVRFEPVAAHAALTVPSLAVLRTGQRNVVVVALGGGRFAPRAVTLGHEGQGYVEIRAGLEAGDRVVTSAQFLIDSEANLQAAIRKMLSDRRSGTTPPRKTADGGHDHAH